MKTTNRTLAIAIILLGVSTTLFAGKVKGKVTVIGDKGMLSIGAGTDSKNSLDGLFRFNANLFLPVTANFGFNVGGDYSSFNNGFQALPKVYSLYNQVTNTAAFVGDLNAKNSGFALQVGPQINFHIGSHLILSPIIAFGLSNMFQDRTYTAVQNTKVGENNYKFDLLRVSQKASNGLITTPKIRLNYMISPVVGLWAEGSYRIAQSVSTEISTLVPQGGINEKGFYEERQLTLGKYETQTVTQSYNAMGVNAGITFAFGSNKAFRIGWDGTVKGGSIQEKGINQAGIKKNDEEADYIKGWDGSVKGSNIQEKGIQESGIKRSEESVDKTTKNADIVNDGNAQGKGITESGIKRNEETSDFRKGWDGTVKGGSIQEKGITENGIKRSEQSVNKKTDGDDTVSEGNAQGKGITQSGIKKNEEASEFRKGWDGTVKGGSIQGKGITESGIKKSDETAESKSWDDSASTGNETQHEVKRIAETLVNLCKADWNGSVKGVANIQSEVKAIAETLVNLTKTDWDGTVKGGSIQEKGINQAGVKKNEEGTAYIKGWDGSVKGSNIQEKGINQAGIKKNESKSNPLYEGNSGSTMNPLYEGDSKSKKSPTYQSQNTEHMSPLYKGNSRTTNSNCGSVSQKTSYPDGTVEELIFACPADAAEYQEMKKVNASKQSQGATFGEKVNAGIQQGSSLLGGALPGGAVISAKSTSEGENPVRQSRSKSNVLKTKHDTAKNSVGNIR